MIRESDVYGLVTDLAAKAPLASPVFTGIPIAPTPTALDNSTKLATTAYVDTSVATAIAAQAKKTILGSFQSII
ncbi:MAG: hypothetical protein JWQ09_5866 [Segetibacter sp.]|nr:hypothetical protein [Segetibacter sp.]